MAFYEWRQRSNAWIRIHGTHVIKAIDSDTALMKEMISRPNESFEVMAKRKTRIFKYTEPADPREAMIGYTIVDVAVDVIEHTTQLFVEKEGVAKYITIEADGSWTVDTYEPDGQRRTG
jgi:hypothetical protein